MTSWRRFFHGVPSYWISGKRGLRSTMRWLAGTLILEITSYRLPSGKIRMVMCLLVLTVLTTVNILQVIPDRYVTPLYVRIQQNRWQKSPIHSGRYVSPANYTGKKGSYDSGCTDTRCHDSGAEIFYRISEDDPCHPNMLSFNETDLSVINNCQFSEFSMDESINKRILNLSELNLPLMRNYRSQCWYERLPASDVTYRKLRHSNQHIDVTYERLRALMASRRQSGHMWRLRCLPLVHVIGVTKSGTTDVFINLVRHPHIVGGATKEVMYWNLHLWSQGTTFADYLDTFDEASEYIRTCTEERVVNGSIQVYHPALSVDATISSLFKFLGARSWAVNKNSRLTGPVMTHAHIIKTVIPNAKIILILRNPVQRLWSEYLFFNNGTEVSGKEFHDLVVEATQRMSDCLGQNRTVRSCVYDKKYWLWHRWVRIVPGMYAPFVEDWLQVFPDMKIVRTEDWGRDRVKVYKELLDFLQLEHIIDERVRSGVIKMRGPSATNNIKMLNRTKYLLTEFYRPYNQRLAHVLKDNRYLWRNE